MIGHAIDTAHESRLFDRIIVSTDDEEISRIAHDFGADVPFRRPAKLSDDHTGTTEVIAHAVNWLQANGSEDLSAVCCIYATAPFVHADDLARALTVLESGDWQYVFSATTYASSIFRSFQENDKGGLRMLFPENFDTRSQDHGEALHDAGQFYWGRPEAWIGLARVFDSHSTIVRIPRWRVQDIDTEEDWMRAECVATYLGLADSSPFGHEQRTERNDGT